MANNEIISIIKKKKELSDLPDALVSEFLENYLKKYKIKISSLTEKELRLIIKETRSELRKIAGRFQKAKKNREKLLREKKIVELLKTHRSTAERLGFYTELKKIINSLKISSILDLGCGLNPIALANKKIKYYAVDIKESDLSLIRQFFKTNNIKGKTFVCDITKPEGFENLPKAELCILFKILDILKKPNKITNAILKKINSKYFLISFATKTLSGKPMRYPKRKWFEEIIRKNECKYKIIESNNEIFYLIYKLTNEKISPC